MSAEAQAPRILRRRKVEDRAGLSCSALYRRIAAGTFPKPINLGSEAVGWLESEVNDWVCARIAERDAAKAA